MSTHLTSGIPMNEPVYRQAKPESKTCSQNISFSSDMADTTRILASLNIGDGNGITEGTKKKKRKHKKRKKKKREVEMKEDEGDGQV